MAPFNTHFLIAEKIWSEVKKLTTWSELANEIHYGQFCFGCVAPDVDKASAGLTQKDTHLFDRTGRRELMASHRTSTFLRQQDEFLGQPFDQFQPEAQAFLLGYLCHLCVDEVSKQMWGHTTWIQFRNVGPGSAFAALDEVARRHIRDFPAIVKALGSIQVLDLIPHIPAADLAAMLQGVRNFAGAETTEGEYLALVDLFRTPTSEQRQQKLQAFRATIEKARQQVHLFKFDTLIKAGLARSHQRLPDLIAGRTPEPGYPDLGSERP
jgi:hypothetical protein